MVDRVGKRKDKDGENNKESRDMEQYIDHNRDHLADILENSELKDLFVINESTKVNRLEIGATGTPAKILKYKRKLETHKVNVNQNDRETECTQSAHILRLGNQHAARNHGNDIGSKIDVVIWGSVRKTKGKANQFRCRKRWARES